MYLFNLTYVSISYSTDPKGLTFLSLSLVSVARGIFQFSFNSRDEERERRAAIKSARISKHHRVNIPVIVNVRKLDETSIFEAR